MAHIIFCATKEGMARRIEELSGPDRKAPFILERGSQIPEAIEALSAGQNVVANAHAAAFGWNVPEGVTGELDPDMNDAQLEALRFQSEARYNRSFTPPEVHFISPQTGSSMDRDILDLLKSKIPVTDPFGDVTPETEPETP